MKKIYSINEIKEKLTPIFEASPIYRAILFGSHAKGKANKNSDVDIFIDSKGEIKGIDFFGILEAVTEALKVKVDLIENRMITAQSPIDIESTKPCYRTVCRYIKDNF